MLPLQCVSVDLKGLGEVLNCYCYTLQELQLESFKGCLIAQDLIELDTLLVKSNEI